jgi:protein subunit release factor A
MKRIMEIKPAEGGNDAKLLVRELSQMYINYFDKKS